MEKFFLAGWATAVYDTSFLFGSLAVDYHFVGRFGEEGFFLQVTYQTTVKFTHMRENGLLLIFINRYIISLTNQHFENGINLVLNQWTKGFCIIINFFIRSSIIAIIDFYFSSIRLRIFSLSIIVLTLYSTISSIFLPLFNWHRMNVLSFISCY